MEKKTIILMSRGMRLAKFFKEAANDLSRDHNVIALVDESELNFWADAAEVCVINFDKEFNAAVDNVKGDINILAAQIEKELGLPIFKAAGNYILFRKFVRNNYSRWKRWVIDDKEMMLRNYVGSYIVLSNIFKKDIPALIFYETADLISCRVATALACNHNVFTLGIKFAPHGWDDKQRMMLVYGWHNRNILLEYYYRNRGLIAKENYDNGLKIIKKLTQRYENPKVDKAYIKEAKQIVSLGGLASLAISRLCYGLLTLQPRKYFRIVFNMIWLNKHFHRELPKDPFIAFFMQYQPEATTCCQAPRWVNQDMIIEQLAINGPNDLKILIKEHNRDIGLRGKGYYKNFLEMHNVYLCHPSIATDSIICGAEAILTTTGTVGFEALMMGKRVATLGRPYYSVFKGIKTLDYPEEIFESLKDPSWRPEEMEDERGAFAAAYVQSLYEFGFGKGKMRWPKTGGDQWAFAIRDFLKKKDEYKLKPDMFDRGY